jgi:hypothetical protein
MPATINLNQLRVASPCPMKWADMAGDDRVRHCSECDLNVYNFAELTRQEATELVLRTEGRLCGILHHRTDGTLLLRDCPVGVRESARRAIRFTARAIAAAVLLSSSVAVAAAGRLTGHSRTSINDLVPIATLRRWLSPAPPPPAGGLVIMGDIALGKVMATSPTAAPPLVSEEEPAQ